MGLADELSRNVRGSHAHIARSIAEDMEREQDEWIAMLRSHGVKAAHPDDGWVDRQENTVHLAYATFNDGLKAGDLLALGWPAWGDKKPRHRIVRVIGFCAGPSYGLRRLAFEALPEPAADQVAGCTGFRARLVSAARRLFVKTTA